MTGLAWVAYGGLLWLMGLPDAAVIGVAVFGLFANAVENERKRL